MRNSLSASVAAALLVAAIPAAGHPPAMNQERDLRWICGGVGADERQALDALRPQANLEVVFASDKRGGYVAGAELAVVRDKGATPVLRITSEGPLCLLHVPAGPYTLRARIGSAERSRTVRVPGKGIARAVLSFPEEPWDGIRASEEEKRQARTP
jgi:hypothetical protein